MGIEVHQIAIYMRYLQERIHMDLDERSRGNIKSSNQDPERQRTSPRREDRRSRHPHKIPQRFKSDIRPAAERKPIRDYMYARLQSVACFLHHAVSGTYHFLPMGAYPALAGGGGGGRNEFMCY